MNAKDVINTDLKYIIKNCIDEFKMLSGNNLLITGGGGFLGYYLVQSIARWNKHSHPEEKIELTVIDNFIRGTPSWLELLLQKRVLKIIKHNIIDPLPEGLGHFQFIIHAASIASPTYYRLRPIETMDANVQGLRNLLEYSKRWNEKGNPLKGFLFFSSSEIYGNPSPDNIPTSESYYGYVSCTGPRACYDESKRYGETLCVNFARQFDMPIKIARPFNNYGPGLKITDKRVIPDFARDILADQDVVMMSDGSPTRTFCYVADAVAGYFKILSKGKAGEAYNIGTRSPEISMAELADRMVILGRELFDYSGKLVRKASMEKEYLVDNPNRRCPDITKTEAEVDYQPSISLDEGLRRTMIWYNENREGSEA